MNIGESVRNFRKSMNMSRKEMSEITGVSPGYIEEIESEKKTPTIEILLKISSAFHITVSELIGESDIKVSLEIKKLIDEYHTLDDNDKQTVKDLIESLSMKNRRIVEYENLNAFSIQDTDINNIPIPENKMKEFIERINDINNGRD